MKTLFVSALIFLVFTSFTPIIRFNAVVEHSSVVDFQSNNLSKVENLQKFYALIDGYIAGRKDKIIITHLGDSHIQADYLTNETRMLLQKAFGNGGRGFVFPYRMLRTNGPSNVQIKYNGVWQSCRSILNGDNCNYGMSGITATTFDSSAFIKINPNYFGDMNYEFDRMKLFYFHSPHAFDLQMLNGDSSILNHDIQPRGHSVSEVFFEKPQDSIWITFKKSQEQTYFQFYGMSLENANRGLVYNAIGQNGAFVKSFLRQTMFEEQMSVLKSDLVIISLGTNDGYMSEGMFCKACFKDNYKELITRVLRSSPNASILLTTPGDFYVRKKYHNANIVLMNEAIYELAVEFKAAVWDFNKVMGGVDGIKRWKDAGLARADLVHFSEEGYVLQGRLLYNALMDGFESRFD